VKQVWTIAKSTFRLLFRTGTGWGVLASVAAVAVLIFFSASGDDVLVSELQLRIRYALGFSTVLVSLSALFLACVSIRHDIDNKILHVITAAPIHRYRVWLGKWLGLLLFSLSGFLTAAAAIAVCATAFTANWKRPADNAFLAERVWRCHRVCRPARPSLAARVEEEYRRRERQAQLPADRPEWLIRNELLQEIRRQEQHLPPGESRTWSFCLWRRPTGTDHVVLRFTLYAEDGRQEVNGVWTVRAVDGPGTFSKQVRFFPYSHNRVAVPVEVVPESGRIEVTFTGTNTPYLIVPREAGVLVSYEEGNMVWNFARLFVAMAMHLAVVVAVGLTAGTAFTYPVAVFLSIVLYLLAIASGFFHNVVQELQWSEPSFLTALTGAVLRFGIWLTQGLGIPPVIGQFSEAIAIHPRDLLAVWGAGFAVYAVLAMGLGMVCLTRKELDRLL